MTLKGLVNNFFKVIHVTITIILTLLAIYLSEEIWVQYAAKDTSFSQSEVKVKEADSPTLVFGFWPLKETNYPDEVPYMAYEQLELGKDFKVRFGIIEGYDIVETIELAEDKNNLEISFGEIGKVNFSKLLTIYGNFYKISANLLSVKNPYSAFVKIDFNKGILDDQLPTIEVSLTAESASFGVTMYDWIDGDAITITPVIGDQAVRIRPEKITKLNQCSQEESFYECFENQLNMQNYSNCPRKCSAVSTITNSIPICKTTEEFICAFDLAKKVKKSGSCLHLCSKTHYKLFKSIYTERTDSENAKRNVNIYYLIPPKEMSIEKEYLIHDFVGMLGSIGGTLGMFIGFSFLGIISSMLKQLQFLLNYMCFKNESSNVVNVKENNITMVKEAKNDIEEICQKVEERILKKLELQRNGF